MQVALPDGCYGRIAPRSGLAYKKGIDVGAGVIDQGTALQAFSKTVVYFLNNSYVTSKLNVKVIVIVIKSNIKLYGFEFNRF